jgi:phosphopantothenoylcysteine decarboxylase/phosphopantothenate--cysteine ligase
VARFRKTARSELRPSGRSRGLQAARRCRRGATLDIASRRQGQAAAARAKRSLRIVITAGPTREFFDSVRFISNASSGKMSYAIAEAAAEAGHDVTLVSGPVSLDAPAGVRTIQVMTAAEMAAAAKRAFRRADAAIFAAAVCDYRPKRRASKKLPKQRQPKVVELVPTKDIAAACGRMKGQRITICFALEDHAGRRHAEAKMFQKKCDAVVLNSPKTVGSDSAWVELLVRGGRWERWGESPKKAVARRLVRVLERLTLRRPPSARG